MKFEQIYSSSKGNLYLVTAQSGKQLLLECGIRWKDIQKALRYDLTNITACCLTHEHKDHSRAIKEVLKAGIKVYATQGTLEALGLAGKRKTFPFRPDNNIYTNCDFAIISYPAQHDAAEPCLFVIRADKEFLLFAPDTSHITQRFKIPFNIIAIECSYDKDILQKLVDIGDINKEVAKRLWTSHTEKQTAMRYLAEFCDLSQCREIHLLHMSNSCINKEQTKMEFEKKFFIETRIVTDGSVHRN